MNEDDYEALGPDPVSRLTEANRLSRATDEIPLASLDLRAVLAEVRRLREEIRKRNERGA